MFRIKSIFKRPLLWLIILLGILALSGCTGVGAVPRGWSGGVVADNTLFVGSMEGELLSLDTDNGSRLWAEPLKGVESSGWRFGCAAPGATSIAIYGSPAASGDLVYVGGYNGKIYAISSTTRLSKDKYLRQDEKSPLQPVVGGPAIAGDAVYIGSADGSVYALDAVSLAEKWRFQTGGKIWSTPVVAGDTLFIGSFDKKLYAIDTATGKSKWEKPFQTGGAIVATPLVNNGTVYVGSFDRYLYAVEAVGGRLKWKFRAESWFWAKPVIHDKAIYTASLDGKVHALDAEGGSRLAEFDLGSPVSSSPVVVGSSIIVATEVGEVYALDTANNQSKRLVNLKEKIYAPLFASQGTVYVHTANDFLYALDAGSGAAIWPPLSLKSVSSAAPAPSGGTNWGLLISIALLTVVLVILFGRLARRRKV